METEIDLLGTIFGYWRENAAETERVLGKDKAHSLAPVYSDALDIQFAVSKAYPNEEFRSLTCGLVMGLPKEIHWPMVMFLAGNYPLFLARLRFIWELVFRALYVDTYKKKQAIRSRLDPL